MKFGGSGTVEASSESIETLDRGRVLLPKLVVTVRTISY